MTLEERAAIVGRKAREKCVFCEASVRQAALIQLQAAVHEAICQERASALLRAARDQKEGGS